jgi:hypothetical protein
MQTCGINALDFSITAAVASLSLLASGLGELISPTNRRGTRTRAGRGGEAKALKAATYRNSQHTHHGDDRAMRASSKGGIRGEIWWAWCFTRMEPVRCALVDLPAGKFGTLTPASQAQIKTVCPGLAS